MRSDDGTFFSFSFGTAGDLPQPADYDGDQLAAAAVFRPSTNEWYILKSTGGGGVKTFGAAGDQIVPNVFLP